MRRKYPWEEWLKRPRIVLVRGIHYECSQSTMSQSVRNNASARGLRIRIQDTGDTIIIDIISRRGIAGAHPRTNTSAVTT